MLSRLVRIQLVIFAITSAVGLTVMAVVYLRLPTLVDVGRITVRVQMPNASGLYPLANVTYRGVEIGQVSGVDVDRTGATATLSLNASAHVPADLQAAVRSVSAIGEQYVDLRPRSDNPPYLHDGSVIGRQDVVLPQPVGPMVDHLSAFLGSLPQDQIKRLLTETSTAFDGAGPDLATLIDSSSRAAADLRSASTQAGHLIDDSRPVLQGQLRSADDLRQWTHDLADVTDQLVTDDPPLRRILSTGPGALDEATALLDQIKPTLPILLANLTTVGQVLVTYRPALEQLLVLLPPSAAFYMSEAGQNNATGKPIGDFHVSISDPPACTVGFLPPSAWRNPDDTSEVDTPDGLYCKLPQDSPISVRGARNYPCMAVPGKFAPTVEECSSDKPFQPLALRQHALGPYPLDPNLISQGIPPDQRVTPRDHTYAPVQGTPLPPGATPSGTPPGPNEGPPIPTTPPPAPSPATPPGPADTTADSPPAPNAEPAPAPNAADVAPSAFHQDPTSPSVATARYDPKTGRYATPDGQAFTQTNVTSAPPHDWRSVILPTGS